MRTFLLFSMVLSITACGDDGGTADASGDTSVRDGASDSAADATPDAAGDAAADAPGDAAVDCSTAAEGGACTVEGASCGGPCTDVCSFCNILRCEGGEWTRLEVFPAPCFDCGPEKQCEAGATYCSRTIAGVPGGGDEYECLDAPDRCAGSVTCMCIADEGLAGDCNEPNPNEVTLTIAAP